MIRAMELFALLQVMGSSGSGVFEMISAINILVFGVFVAVVMATVLLMGINRKMRELKKAIVEMAAQTKNLASNS